MNRPTAEEIDAAKAKCRERFGHARVLGIALGDPIDLYVVVAVMTLRDAEAFVDARAVSTIQANSALVHDRALWPLPDAIAKARASFPALDAKIAQEFVARHGANDVPSTALPFSAATAPAGFAAPADLAAKALELQAAHPHAKLYSVTNRANGLALVMAAPSEEVFTAATSAAAEAHESKKGILSAVLRFAHDLIVWSPKPLAQYWDEAPWRVNDLAGPFFDMGGASAQASSTFL